MQYERLLAFGSTHMALKAEALLKAEGVKFRLLPAPKEFTDYCALVLGLSEVDTASAVELLEKKGASPKTIFKSKGDGYVKV